MVTFDFLRWQPPPTHHLWPFALPLLEGYPRFFRQNDRKGFSLDYLHGLGHSLFGFGATGNNLLGGGNHLLGKTSVK